MVKADTGVSGGHKVVLFTRDYASLSLLIAVPLISLACLMVSDPGLLISYIALLSLQYLLVRLAAEHYGRRLVTNVLALVSSR